MRYQMEWKPCTNLQDQTWNTKEILCFMEGYFEQGPQTYRGWGWVLSSANVGKETTCNAGGSGLIPGSGRSSEEGIGYSFQYSWASLVAQMVKNPRAMQETWVMKVSWRREWQPSPVFFPGESPLTEVPGGLQFMGLQKVGHNWVTKHNFPIRHHYIHHEMLICFLLFKITKDLLLTDD